MEQNRSGKNGEPDVETEEIKDDVSRFFRLKGDQKKMNDDLRKMTAARESTEHLAEDFGRRIASEITGFGSMLKSSQQSIGAMEEKLLRLADEIGDVKKDSVAQKQQLAQFSSQFASLLALKAAFSETSAKMAALEQLPAMNEKLSRQEELGRAVMAVLDDFKARLSDYPTRGEIEPLWKEAEAVMLDDLNRQRADMKALLAALAEDYRDGALSERTYLETKGKTEEKLAVLEDKVRRFAAAVSEKSEAKKAQPAPVGEKEKLAEAKLAELRQREERLGILEKRLDEFSRQTANLRQREERLGVLEKRLEEFSRQTANFNQAIASNSTKLAALENELLRRQPGTMIEKEDRRGIVGGLLGKILSAEHEHEEKPAEPKRREEEAPPLGAKMELPAQAITPEGGKEARLKREVEELESALAKIREKKSGTAREPFLLKLKEQKQELETLLKIVEKRRMEGEIASESYGSIRARTLERLQKINELLSGQRRNPYG